MILELEQVTGGPWHVVIGQPDEGPHLTPIVEIPGDEQSTWQIDQTLKVHPLSTALALATRYAVHVNEVQDRRYRDKVYLLSSNGNRMVPVGLCGLDVNLISER